jgi:glycosyltransferase involved in cell wall biosynthesis
MVANLSVVIPVHNGMPYIKEALESVLLNKDAATEIIVRENGSTDGTLEWLQSQSELPFTLVVSESLISAADNWTAACRLASAPYIKLLCADDYVTEGALARQLSAATEHPEAALVASARRIINESGRTIMARRGLGGLTGLISSTRAQHRAAFSGANPFGEPSSVLFRADALMASLPFGDDYPYVTDLQMYVRVLEHGDFFGLRTVDAVFRLHNASWSQKIGSNQLHQFREWAKSLEDSGIIHLNVWHRITTQMRFRLSFIARSGVSWYARQQYTNLGSTRMK